jgi:hypothetical protein
MQLLKIVLGGGVPQYARGAWPNRESDITPLPCNRYQWPMADGESSSKRRPGFGFIVKVVAGVVVIVLAVVVIVGDDETRAALLSRLRGDGGASPDR